MNTRLTGWPRVRAVLAVLAAMALVLGVGFQAGASARPPLLALDLTLAAAFLLELSLDLARGGSVSLRRRWYEVLLVVVLVSVGIWAELTWQQGFGASARAELELHAPVALTHFIARIYLFLLVGIVLLRRQAPQLAGRFRPETLLVGGFALVVAVGTLLLLLPRAAANSEAPIGFLDALFTSTSATCVTGLVVRDTGADFSLAGQLVLVCLFQIGGLGILTFIALVPLVSGERLSVPQMVTLREVLSARSLSEVGRHLRLAFVGAFAIEAAGVLVLFLARPDLEGFLPRLHWAVFHAVSAYCNAGFALATDSLTAYRGDVAINLTIVFLILVGGLGVLATADLVELRLPRSRLLSRLPWIGRTRAERGPSRLRIQTRLALIATLVLVAVGWILVLALEWNHSLRDLPGTEKLLASLFHSVTPRTAGFNTLETGALSSPTRLVTVIFMVIGAAPVSTGGGIKTVTLLVLVLAVRAFILGRPVEVFGRTIPEAVVRAALGVTALYVASAILVTFGLAVTDPHVPLDDLAFEAISALSTVGLSTGITADLSSAGRLVLCLAMFAGRVGPLSLVLSLVRRRREQQTPTYPEESLLLG